MGTADSDSDAATKAAGGDTNNRPGPSGLPSDLALGRAARRALRNLRREVPVTHCGDLASDPEFLLRTVRAIYGPGGEGGPVLLVDFLGLDSASAALQSLALRPLVTYRSIERRSLGGCVHHASLDL